MVKATRSARPKRTQTCARASATVLPEPGNDVDERRERKRVTDREAQREHRKRQKVYIEELETQLDFVKKTACTDQVVTLLAENEKLHQELKALRTFLASIEGLVETVRPRDQLLQRGQPRTASIKEQEIPEAGVAARNTPPNLQSHSATSSSPEEIQTLHHVPLSSLRHQEMVDPGGHSMDVTQVDTWNSAESGGLDLPLVRTFDSEDANQRYTNDGSYPNIRGGASSNGNSYQMPDFNLDGWPVLPEHIGMSHDFNMTVGGTDSLPPWLRNLFSSAAASPSGPPQEIEVLHQSRGRSRWLNTDHTMTNWNLHNSNSQPVRLEQVMASQDLPTFTTEHDANSTLPSSLEGHGNFGHNSNRHKSGAANSAHDASQMHIMDALTKAPFQHPPCLMTPPLMGDLPLHDIVDLTRRCVASGQQYPSGPMWTDFLIDNASNPLSLSVKTYLQPMQKMARTAEVLTSYWIIYLLLRWQAILTPESFGCIPLWLRPTQLQRTVRHPISAGFMPWPHIRDSVVLHSFNNPGFATEAMTTLGTYLEVDLTAAHAIALQDNGQQLNASIADLRNWKLREGFFVKYPQWRELYERSISEFCGSK